MMCSPLKKWNCVHSFWNFIRWKTFGSHLAFVFLAKRCKHIIWILHTVSKVCNSPYCPRWNSKDGSSLRYGAMNLFTVIHVFSREWYSARTSSSLKSFLQLPSSICKLDTKLLHLMGPFAGSAALYLEGFSVGLEPKCCELACFVYSLNDKGAIFVPCRELNSLSWSKKDGILWWPVLMHGKHLGTSEHDIIELSAPKIFLKIYIHEIE